MANYLDASGVETLWSRIKNVFVTDASADGKSYVRKNKSWVESSSTGGGVQSAELDGNILTIVNQDSSSLVMGVNGIPYDSSTDDSYTMTNKVLIVQDSMNSDASVIADGQALTVTHRTASGVDKASRIGYDGVAVMDADGDIFGDNPPRQYVASTISADLRSSESGFNISAVFNSGESTVSGHLGPRSVMFSTDIGESDSSIEIGYTDGQSLTGDRNMLVKFTDSAKGDGVYVLRNEGDGLSDVKHIATEEWVNLKKQNKLTAGADIKIENDVISVEEDWNVTILDTAEFNKGQLSISAPSGYVFDRLYVLCHWYCPAGVATSVYGGFYSGKNTDASRQVLRNNGTNKMGAAYFTANVINIDNTSAIAYGDAYFYNSNGSAAALNNPINSYGIGRFSHSNDFTHFTIHNYPSSITEGYCCFKYKLKKQ